ncbi:MAG: family, FAD-dependent NAD(P)-disulfide oxidoreductase [Labilithrix sp.]|nr:family, FAD-dependent NAD(P)-disulfide oxidoreductase [Labilithrix sp.]
MKTDVIVIGSGQAGVPLATRLVHAGKTVLVVERGALGGTCVNYGCTPTKTMVASARAAHVARTAGRLGVHVADVRVDFAAVIDRKNAIVQQWRAGVERRLTAAGGRLHVAHGHARFVGPHEIEVEGQRHQADTIIVNTGARPFVPPIPGLDGVPFVDNAGVMELRELPGHLVVLGGGYVGCEFAQMFRRFGSEVTIIDRNEHLLSREDADTSSALEAVFRGEGIALELMSDVASVRRENGHIVVRTKAGKDVRGTHLLVAVGRRPNTDDLGCDAAGLDLDARGFVSVDDGYATSIPGVFAVGDVTGGPQFTHTAWDDHRLLFERLQGRSAHGRAGRVIPYCVFTDPHVAGVGLTERELRAKGIAYEVATMSFGDIARSIEVDERAGTMKVMIDPKTERVLGCRLVGSEAGELIHIVVTLMQAGASVRAIVDAEAVHPTFAEGVQSLVMRLPRFTLQ